MTPRLKSAVARYIEEQIPAFHKRRLERLQSLQFTRMLQRKNPYLFRAKHLVTAEQFVRTLLDAYLSSQEETLFGATLEGLAQFVCSKTFGAYKSSAEGIDMEFERDGTHYIVAIKSGPNWANSSQIRRMLQDFRQAKRILTTNMPRIPIIAVNGCCYGREAHEQKTEYVKLCGQAFWAFISGDERLYLDIIEPLGHKAREHNEEFAAHYTEVINQFARQFANEFCMDNGRIDWEKIVRLTSARKQDER